MNDQRPRVCNKCGSELMGDLCGACYNENIPIAKPSRLKKALKYSVIIALLIGIYLWANPFLRLSSESTISQRLKHDTPIGLTFDQGYDFLKSRWPEGRLSITILEPTIGQQVGSKSIGPVEIGWYWTLIPGLPMITYVYADWVFDENDHFVDVVVVKAIDAL